MLSKLIDNSGNGGTPCEKVLGSTPRVNKIATFWQKEAALIEIIVANVLLEYTQTEDYNSDQSAHVRLVLGKVGEFFQDCWAEREARIQAALKASKET